VPWKTVIWINFTDSNEGVLAKTVESCHSRFPVVDEDTIVGFVHVKELQALKATGGSWERLIRPMLTVREDAKILEAFMRIQQERQHMAGVVNQDGKLLGIITLENILQEIVGEMGEEIPRERITKLLARRRRFNFGNYKYPT
jgi:CBS domain containing-hemolysin-like protein